MTHRHIHLQEVQLASNELIEAGNFGADQIEQRNNEISSQWESLIDLATYRKKRLNEAVDFYQVGFHSAHLCYYRFCDRMFLLQRCFLVKNLF